jgi:hypothetical protein
MRAREERFSKNLPLTGCLTPKMLKLTQSFLRCALPAKEPIMLAYPERIGLSDTRRNVPDGNSATSLTYIFGQLRSGI